MQLCVTCCVYAAMRVDTRVHGAGAGKVVVLAFLAKGALWPAKKEAGRAGEEMTSRQEKTCWIPTRCAPCTKRLQGNASSDVNMSLLVPSSLALVHKRMLSHVSNVCVKGRRNEDQTHIISGTRSHYRPTSCGDMSVVPQDYIDVGVDADVVIFVSSDGTKSRLHP